MRNQDKNRNKETVTSETAQIKLTGTQRNERIPKRLLQMNLTTRLEQMNKKGIGERRETQMNRDRIK